MTSPQELGHFEHRFEARSEARRRLPMLLQLAVRKVADAELRHAGERRSPQLQLNIVAPAVGRHKEQRAARADCGPQRQVQHAHDARIDRCRVLDLERGAHLAASCLEPDHVDEPDRLCAGRAGAGELSGATVSELAVAIGPASIIGGDPHLEPQRLAEVPQPALNLRVRGVALPFSRPLLLQGRRLGAHLRQVGFPGLKACTVSGQRRRLVATRADFEQQTSQRAKVVGQARAVLSIQPDRPLAHGQVVVPATKLHIAARHRVVALDDGGVERQDQRGVDEVQQVCDRWAQPLDLLRVDALDRVDDRLRGIAAVTRVQQPRKRPLVVGVFVDVGDAELGLPQEGVVRTLEDLPLLGNRAHHRLQRRTTVRVAEGSGLDVLHHLADASADRPEILQPLFPQEPAVVGAVRIGLPVVNQQGKAVVHSILPDQGGLWRWPCPVDMQRNAYCHRATFSVPAASPLSPCSAAPAPPMSQLSENP
mmetsp:Transcript_61794/g.146106  ORF Transcript_61794/g.146106 Transcript_61794/m.146106 type:complete len:480 (-) Transcript_61794:495-1934(-)